MKIICFSVVIFATFSLIRGAELLPSSTLSKLNNTSLNASSDATPSVEGVCYFGRFPSARCMFRCFLKSKSSFCDEQARCLCRSQEDKVFEESLNSPEYNFSHTTTAAPIVSNPESETAKNESDPSGNRRVIYYIFDLNKIFGMGNGTESSHIMPKESSRSLQGVWTMPHILAMSILALLVVLVILEVMHLCKRKNSKRNFQQSILAPTMSEKAYVCEKQ